MCLATKFLVFLLCGNYISPIFMVCTHFADKYYLIFRLVFYLFVKHRDETQMKKKHNTWAQHFILVLHNIVIFDDHVLLAYFAF